MFLQLHFACIFAVLAASLSFQYLLKAPVPSPVVSKFGLLKNDGSRLAINKEAPQSRQNLGANHRLRLNVKTFNQKQRNTIERLAPDVAVDGPRRLTKISPMKPAVDRQALIDDFQRKLLTQIALENGRFFRNMTAFNGAHNAAAADPSAARSLEDQEHEANIAESLRQLEASEHVRIIYASECGERAWQYASTHSAYDVRFVYVRQSPAAANYSSQLSEASPIPVGLSRQFVSSPSSSSAASSSNKKRLVSLTGFDLDVAFNRIARMNAPAIEMLYAPHVYRADESMPLAQVVRFVLEQTEQTQHSRLLENYLNMAARHVASLPPVTNTTTTTTTRMVVPFKDYMAAIRCVAVFEWLALKYATPELSSALKPATTHLVEIDLVRVVNDLVPLRSQHERSSSLHEEIVALAYRARVTGQGEQVIERVPVVDEWMKRVLAYGFSFMYKMERPTVNHLDLLNKHYRVLLRLAQF